MSTMNSEVYDALVDAGADEAKAREAAKSVARYDGDIAGIKASLLLLEAGAVWGFRQACLSRTASWERSCPARIEPIPIPK